MATTPNTAAISGDTAVPRTPEKSAATYLSGTGSQFHSLSPPPAIRIQQHDHRHDSDLTSANRAAASGNTRIHYDASSHYPIGDNAALSSFDSSDQRVAQRPRFDSLLPLSASSDGYPPRSGSNTFSDSGLRDDSENEDIRTPIIRRGSIRSNFKEAQLDQISHDLERDIVKDDDSQYSDSSIYSIDSLSESDLEHSRPYTGRLELPKVPSFARGKSTVSDGGEQDHLDQITPQNPKHSAGTASQPLSIITRSSAGIKPQRYALQKLVYSKMIRTRQSDSCVLGQQFFPKDQLRNVIDNQKVFMELRTKLKDYTEMQIHVLADKICNITKVKIGGGTKKRSFRAIFAILVLTDKTSAIEQFLKDNVSDLDLPLKAVTEAGAYVGMCRRKHSSASTLGPQQLLECFDEENWSPGHLETFDRNQWLMLAPFFSMGKDGEIKHYPLKDQHVLPFENSRQAEDDAAEGEGGFGKVIMVRIHSAHHKLSCDAYNHRGFAVKQLRSKDSKAFKREREMLKKFKHDHIISLLATYRHCGKYHFIFDRADGNLGEFWERSGSPPRLYHHDILWISKQCYGLSSGLSNIHKHFTLKTRLSKHEEDCAHKAGNRKVRIMDPYGKNREFTISKTEGQMDPQLGALPGRTLSSEVDLPETHEVRYGRHGDINPQNILWFDGDDNRADSTAGHRQGILRLADFGTAELNSKFSKSKERDVANTLTYRPPECDTDQRINQMFDIWCFGCVLLEFATWMIGGQRMLERFSKNRLSRDEIGNDEADTYFELVWNKDTRKTEARIKLSVIEFVQTLRADPRCTEYLHAILNLVMHDMLVIDAKQRAKCKAVCNKLEDLHKKCHEEAFATTSSAWPSDKPYTPKNYYQRHEVKLSKEAQRRIAKHLPLKQVTNDHT